jgi:hypothetical protein
MCATRLGSGGSDGPGLPDSARVAPEGTYWPRVTGSVDGDGVRREAVEIRESPGIGVGDQRRLREYASMVLGLGEVEVANGGGGGRQATPCSLAEQRQRIRCRNTLERESKNEKVSTRR